MVHDISNKRIILFGCGAVQKCVLNLLDDFLKIDPKKLYIFDLIDYRHYPQVQKYMQKGARYCITDLNKSYKKIIGKLKPYDIIIDLTNHTETIEFVKECKKRNVHYINTSIEVNSTINEEKKKEKEVYERTYTAGHNDILEINKTFPKNKASQCMEMGANPGLISIFVKLGLLFLAKKSKMDQTLQVYVKNRDYNKIAHYLNVEIIHCSETDSSCLTDREKLKVFTNTWCCNAMIDEYSCNSEFTYGSHEKSLPAGAELLHDNIIRLKEPAAEVYCESYVPYNGKIIGVVIPHGEGISLGSFLRDENYSPTMNYVYKIPPIVYESLKLFHPKLGDEIKSTHVLNNYDDTFDGMDRLGALLVTKDKKSVWIGSCLDNSKIEYDSGTTQQVAAGILSGLSYIIENPNDGVYFPEHFPVEYIIKLARPYLGELFCNFVDYKPKSTQFIDLQRTKKQFDKQYKKK